jgi:ribosomal protein RSM22 (predicted rRNA methylase)
MAGRPEKQTIRDENCPDRLADVPDGAYLAPMTHPFPAHLAQLLDHLSEGHAHKALAARASLISDSYRTGKDSAVAIRDDVDALAYALVRMPATFAATSSAIGIARHALPDFARQSVLDLGAGPGTASFAAIAAWAGLTRIMLMDRPGPLKNLAGLLNPQAEIIDADLSKADLVLPRADIVLASYVLAELSAATIPAFARSALAAAQELLVMVEPGTPEGYRRMMLARQALIAGGAKILAPCPGNSPCPISAPDWCHFSVRLARARNHKTIKGAEIGFEDERYCYLIVSANGRGEPSPARILAPPRKSKIGIDLKLCTEAGLVHHHMPSRDRKALAYARRLDWGDEFNQSEPLDT